MSKKRTKPIPELKKKAVKEILDSITGSKTFLIASIKGLPAKQFQEIKKKLRKSARMKVAKKNIIFRAIDQAKQENLEKIKEHIEENVALLFSDMDCFELSLILSENKTPAKAKIGQEAPEDIKIESGETELTPGPVISEFGALGIKIAIEDGKINIKDSKIIVKKGEPVSEGAASIMGKLNITPFNIGLLPVAAYDVQEKKVYENLEINKQETLGKLQNSFAKARAFAVSIGYASKETIGFLLAKAASHAKALEKLIGAEKKEEPESKGSGEDNTQENKSGE